MRYEDAVRYSAVAEYESKATTVEQILKKHGIARRTLYNWVSADRGRRNDISRKAVYLSADEVETVLLMIMVADGQLKDREWIAKALESRLLDIADSFTEIEKVRK